MCEEKGHDSALLRRELARVKEEARRPKGPPLSVVMAMQEDRLRRQFGRVYYGKKGRSYGKAADGGGSRG